MTENCLKYHVGLVFSQEKGALNYYDRLYYPKLSMNSVSLEVFSVCPSPRVSTLSATKLYTFLSDCTSTASNVSTM